MSDAAVLSADDSPDDALLLQSACRRAGVRFHLQTVEDGTDAIGYLRGDAPYQDRATHPFPRLLLLDLKMPRKTGFDVLEWVRQQESLRGLSIAVFTSSQHDVDIRRAYDLGANHYLMKPVDFNALLQIVKALDQTLPEGDVGEALRQLPFYKADPRKR